jgi:tRNA-modifying protein YgfZ
VDTVEAYEVARAGGVTVDRTGRGLLRLTGPQRIWFLENTVTAAIEDIGDGTWRESCFLTPKGKLVAHFRVGVLADDVWVEVDPPAGDLAEWFIKYRFRTKVDIEDSSRGVTTVLGPPAAELAMEGEVVVRDGAVIFGSKLGDVPVADVHGELHSDLVAAPVEVYDVFRLEAGVAAFGTDYGTDNLPQEAGLTRTVSVSKGCYVGQETVARIHFRGHINKVVRPLVLDGVEVTSAAGRNLELAGERRGTLTSAAWSPRREGVGIGMLRADVEEGATLDVEGGGVALVGPIPEGTKVAS